MNAIDVLAMLQDRGIAVWVEPDGLHIRPASALTPELRKTVRGHKDAIIQQLVADRRDDLADDSAWWRDLLTRAHDIDGDDPAGLYGALHGLRCHGARLSQTTTGLHVEAGNMGAERYAEVRERSLIPHGQILRRLLHCCPDPPMRAQDAIATSVPPACNVPGHDDIWYGQQGQPICAICHPPAKRASD